SVAMHAVVVAGVLDSLCRKLRDHAERGLPLDRALVEIVGGDLRPRRTDRGETIFGVQHGPETYCVERFSRRQRRRWRSATPAAGDGACFGYGEYWGGRVEMFSGE